MKRSARLSMLVGVAALAGAALYALLRAAPVEVDVAAVHRGVFVASISEQAVTRSHDQFTVAAPVAGRVLRLTLHEGDSVSAGQTIAELAPVPLGERETRELEARLASARSIEREAQERLSGAQHDLASARRERGRLEGLADRKLVAAQSLDLAKSMESVAEHAVSAARDRLASAAADAAAVRASLTSTRSGPAAAPPLVSVRSPVAGRVLRVSEKSDRVVAAGSPLLVLGDLSRLEVVIALLSTDAVRIRPGMPVRLDGWGGERDLRARVSRVEPYAFTKVSALGVEEQRTNVIADFLESSVPLGDGYRLNAHIETYRAASAVQVPASAVFPCSLGTCVFAIDGNRARRRAVSVGHLTADFAEVLDGLAVGTGVIVYPSNEVSDGARIHVRQLPTR